MRELRGRSREIATAVGAQARSATATAADVELVLREATALRTSTGDHLERVTALSETPASPAGRSP
jgi:hypothetical protein